MRTEVKTLVLVLEVELKLSNITPLQCNGLQYYANFFVFNW
jgi:hypothetical protein